jgi:hypothetical protein
MKYNNQSNKRCKRQRLDEWGRERLRCEASNNQLKEREEQQEEIRGEATQAPGNTMQQPSPQKS